MINSLDISAFENGRNFISLGKIRPEIVSFLIEKEPSVSGQLNSETEILFWKDRLRHTELHKDDFSQIMNFTTVSIGFLSLSVILTT